MSYQPENSIVIETKSGKRLEGLVAHALALSISNENGGASLVQPGSSSTTVDVASLYEREPQTDREEGAEFWASEPQMEAEQQSKLFPQCPVIYLTCCQPQKNQPNVEMKRGGSNVGMQGKRPKL
jgi:hypothetical protein